MIIKFAREVDRKRNELDDRLWFHGDLKAHIANFTKDIKKVGGGEWTYKDFVRLSYEVEQQKVKEKLTLKKAKQTLGSTFKLNSN